MAFISSLVWLIPFLSLLIENGFVFLVLVGGAGFVIIMVLTIVKDLDDPFKGAWRINIDSWYEFLESIAPTLVFVYNIKSSLYERGIKYVAGKLLKLKICNLKDLTHKWIFESKEWINMSKRIQEKLVIKNLYSNQYFNDIYHENINVSELPLVVYRNRDAFSVLINSQEINNCQDLTEFEKVIKQKLEEKNLTY